ncbi:hepatoma-derived growth factor-like [Drosophila madeirensis]|uniref:Hepatoma-derived growth factor-like n=1 Tax=Drosophila madeirensis TaxID=30013 RepID=A0AAU9FY17_DROMD
MPKQQKKIAYKKNDLVFAKIRGYTPWPAVILNCVDGKDKYLVQFYGTHDKGNIKGSKNLFPYIEYKEKFATEKNLRRVSYARALQEIERASHGPIDLDSSDSDDGDNNNNNPDQPDININPPQELNDEPNTVNSVLQSQNEEEPPLDLKTPADLDRELVEVCEDVVKLCAPLNIRL